MGKEREVLETLVYSATALGLLAVAFFGFSRSQKEEFKKQRTDIEDKSKLEVHHITPRYLGGDSSDDNGEALTRVEHALEHWETAMNSSGNDRDANYWAVKKIVQRMSMEELEEFNRSISKKH